MLVSIAEIVTHADPFFHPNKISFVLEPPSFKNEQSLAQFWAWRPQEENTIVVNETQHVWVFSNIRIALRLVLSLIARLSVPMKSYFQGGSARIN